MGVADGGWCFSQARTAGEVHSFATPLLPRRGWLEVPRLLKMPTPISKFHTHTKSQKAHDVTAKQSPGEKVSSFRSIYVYRIERNTIYLWEVGSIPNQVWPTAPKKLHLKEKRKKKKNRKEKKNRPLAFGFIRKFSDCLIEYVIY